MGENPEVVDQEDEEVEQSGVSVLDMNQCLTLMKTITIMMRIASQTVMIRPLLTVMMNQAVVQVQG